ncbi:MAG TPA: DUF1572 family protein [Gemmatimonadaceae bacterium]|jgi:hypothetical protein|nr:DUF1572 family protein [Gemmatimonadaceae bacterium]
MPDRSTPLGTLFLDDTTTTFRRQKELLERAVAQVEDDEFFQSIDGESNSIAIIVKHIGGNLRSRFTDFLDSDGEKPDRDRDREFETPQGTSRSEIMALWESGWTALFGTLGSLGTQDLERTVYIRGEPVHVVGALHRALAHVSQHVGQAVMLAKHFRSADWKTLSIPRGQSRDWRPPSPPAR